MDFYSVKNRPPREQLQLDYETSLLEVTNEISIKTQVERLLSAGERLHAYMNGDEYDYDGEIPDDDDFEPPYELDTATDMLNEMEYQESKLVDAQTRAQARAQTRAQAKKQQSESQQTDKVEAEEKTPQGEL